MLLGLFCLNKCYYQINIYLLSNKFKGLILQMKKLAHFNSTMKLNMKKMESLNKIVKSKFNKVKLMKNK